MDHTIMSGQLEKTECQRVMINNVLDGRYKDGIDRDARNGLTTLPKSIPSKYFYDAHGSKLFDDICGLPEYYPTRLELAILNQFAPDIMRNSNDRDLVELGSGDNTKVRVLLEATGRSNRGTLRYIPVDISEAAVVDSSQDLGKSYPELQVTGLVADFTCQLNCLPNERPKTYLFLGSTIGNLNRQERSAFLWNLARNMGPEDTLLVGFDMIKPKAVLEAAYNDSEGVTAEFNKNVLNVLNRELDGDFIADHFDHLAFFNEDRNRMEMHLKANCDSVVNLGSLGLKIDFRQGETIHTENSRKFLPGDIKEVTSEAGLTIKDWYYDPKGWFSLVVMGPGNGGGNQGRG
ncbi:MAG: L-histidine N(alpha)-methyltransferase [Dehalococcoidia bacterium]